MIRVTLTIRKAPDFLGCPDIQRNPDSLGTLVSHFNNQVRELGKRAPDTLRKALMFRGTLAVRRIPDAQMALIIRDP